MMLESYSDQMPESAAEYAVTIYKSANKLNDVFNDLIEITRADAGEITLEKNETNLIELVERSIEDWRPWLDERQLDVSIDSAEECPVIFVDLKRINRVLSMFLSNAQKHAPVGGKISFHIARVNSHAELPRSAPLDTVTPCYLVQVSDTGEGLPREEVDRVFLPLYRTRASQRQRLDGAGLGLAIAQKYIELHHGNLWAAPAVQKQPGGRFLFTIPIADSNGQ